MWCSDCAVYHRELHGRGRRQRLMCIRDRGIAGARPGEAPEHVPCLPLRGEIDIVGAGDAVMANLAMALAGGAAIVEAMKFAMAAASVVVHQLGTTGTANLRDIRPLVCAY